MAPIPTGAAVAAGPVVTVVLEKPQMFNRSVIATTHCQHEPLCFQNFVLRESRRMKLTWVEIRTQMAVFLILRAGLASRNQLLHVLLDADALCRMVVLQTVALRLGDDRSAESVTRAWVRHLEEAILRCNSSEGGERGRGNG